jgi:hypothetical protein
MAEFPEQDKQRICNLLESHIDEELQKIGVK